MGNSVVWSTAYFFVRSTLAVVYSAVVPLTAQAESGPVIKISDSVYEFGSVPQGQRVDHEFVIRNEGDADLIIQRISPSCGCTAATATSNVIKAGTSEKLKVIFHTAGFFGEKTKSVTVVTNARNEPESTMKLHGSVIRDIIVTPERVDFGDVTSETSDTMRTREIVVEVAEGASREIAGVRSGSPSISVTPLGNQGRGKRYAVKLLPDAPRGLFRDRVLVELKDPGLSAVNVPVMASILGDLRLVPSSVSFGIVSGSEMLERRVRFENSSKGPVDVTEVVSSHPAVTASVQPVTPGKRSVIVIQVDPKKISGDLRANLTVKTSSADSSTLSLAVFGVEPPK